MPPTKKAKSKSGEQLPKSPPDEKTVRKARRTKVDDSRSVSKTAGQALRDKVPRKSHATWKQPSDRPDPVEMLEQSNQGRIQELVPIRYGRMLQSPFTFLRGSAAVMAHDLAGTPSSGLWVQACGDCHVLNFGLFATPERNLVFDLNDFDESHPAPWEWDLKRLVISLVTAGRERGLSDAQCRDAVEVCVASYREHMRECADMSPLDIWYKRLDIDTLIKTAPDAKARETRERLAREARSRIIDHLFPKITAETGGEFHLVDQPPILFHPNIPDWRERVLEGMSEYRDTLAEDRRILFDRYELKDAALKVVGIGSVGTRCFIGLFMSDDKHPLMLQFKEAGRSVLEPYTNKSRYANQGERVVIGQRLMQSSSDIFLGWARGRGGADFYVRQLRDMKLSVPMDDVTAETLTRYATFCSWTLARAHAKSSNPTAISSYLGSGDNFDRALAKFAIAYADQNESDHAALVKAVRSGRIQALAEE